MNDILENVFDVASEAFEIAKGKRLVKIVKKEKEKVMATIKEEGIESGYTLKVTKKENSVRIEIHELIGGSGMTITWEAWVRIVKGIGR